MFRPTAKGEPAVTRLVLVRHGRTAYNVERRFQGCRDIPLDEVGRSQARALASELTGESFDRILSSDLSRARATAAEIADALGLAVETERRLRECGYGEWEGRTLVEVRAERAQEYADWLENSVPAPGGEPYPSVRERVGSLADELVATHPDSDLLLVSHSGAIKMLIGHCLGIDIAACRRFYLTEGGHCEVQHSVELGWRLNYLNRVPRGGGD
jgi:broad specificity phosphatase PhoE